MVGMKTLTPVTEYRAEAGGGGGGKATEFYPSKTDFPEEGNPTLLYIAQDDNTIYRFDIETGSYVALSSTIDNVEDIDGGTATGRKPS